MKRMKRYGWNLQTMNEYCKEQDKGYSVLDLKWVKKTYQKQLWSLVKCSNKNHEPYWTNWNNFLHGYLCKKCDYENNNKKMWSQKEVIEFYSKNNLNIININEWHSVDQSIKVEDEEGFKYISSITNIKQCGNKSTFRFNLYNPFSLENIMLYCKLYRPDYELLSDEYKGIKEEYEWKYNGNGLPINISPIFPQTADSFINGGCGHPYFSKSNGNKIFENELIRHDITYKREKTFKGCKDKKLLRFDFYLLKSKEIIEIDGLQHEMTIGLFGGEDGYKDRMKKDNIKNEYCKNNGIKITRIPYNTNKIECFKKIVDKKINEILNNEV